MPLLLRVAQLLTAVAAAAATTSCSPGASWSGTACEPCGQSVPPGSFCDGVSTAAAGVLCTAGYSCGGGALTPVECAAGSYSGWGAAACTLCPMGTYNTNEGSTSIAACTPCSDRVRPGDFCPAGTATIDGRQECPMGRFCAGGSAPAIPCPPGTYSQIYGNQLTRCAECPAGTYNPSSGSVYFMYCSYDYLGNWGQNGCPPYSGPIPSRDCLPCNDNSILPGTYCAPGSASEVGVPCPAGSTCAGLSATPVLCPVNTYSFGGATSCTPCPLDTQGAPPGSASAASCLPCNHLTPPGSFCDGTLAGSNGTLCPPGSFCEGGYMRPQLCGNGFFSPSFGAALCTPCPVGTFRLGTSGATSVTQACRIGSAIFNNGPGYFLPGGDLGNENGISACTPGHSCAGGPAPPVPCPAGSYAGAGEWRCSPCVKGQYQPLTGSVACLNCAQGHWCDGGVALPVPCPIGSSSNEGQWFSACNPCSPGQYQPLTGQLQCISCPQGSFCTGGAEQPQPCPLGTHNQGPGNSICWRCPAGQFAVGDGTSCYGCSAHLTPPGFYCSSSAAETLSNGIGSTPCPAGMYCATGNNIEPCHAGSYSLAGAIFCELCPAGTYSTISFASSVTACLPCDFTAVPASQYSREGSGACTPVACPVNSYCPGGSSPALPCPAGSYGATDPTLRFTCTQCVSGTFQVANTSTCAPCVVTQPGNYCPRGTGNETGAPCPAGFTCAGGAAAPVICSTNTYSDAGSTVCTPCPPQTFANFTGAAGVRFCNSLVPLPPPGTYVLSPNGSATLCPSGYACLGGISPPDLCPPGTWAATGQSVCTPCKIGTFSAAEGAGSNATCQSCSLLVESGSYCAAGSAQDVGVPCPAGSSCAGGASAPVPCIKGSYASSGYGHCVSCPTGTYGPNIASTSVELDCASCSFLTPVGFFCAPGSSSPTPAMPCPIGSSCDGGAAAPVLCAPGEWLWWRVTGWRLTAMQMLTWRVPVRRYCAFAHAI